MNDRSRMLRPRLTQRWNARVGEGRPLRPATGILLHRLLFHGWRFGCVCSCTLLKCSWIEILLLHSLSLSLLCVCVCGTIAVIETQRQAVFWW